MNREAELLIDAGKYDVALDKLKRAEGIYLSTVGEADSLTSNVEFNLGTLWRNKGDFQKAVLYHEKALKTRLTIHEENHRKIAIIYTSLGSDYGKLGKYDKALELFHKALKIHLESPEEKHPNLERTYGQIGNILINKGAFNEAISYFEKGLATALETYGDEHYRISIIHEMIGISYNILGDYDKAIQSYEQALQVALSLFGHVHPRVASTHHSIGRVWRMKGNYEKAESYFEKALSTNLAALGENHPEVADDYHEIGRVLKERGAFDRALEYYKRALNIRSKIYGENNPRLSSSYESIGTAWKHKNNYQKAQIFYEKALKIKRDFYGESSPRLASSYDNVAGAWLGMGNYSEALNFYNKALRIKSSFYKTDHPSIASSYHNMGLVHSKWGNYSQALEYYQKALNIKLKLLGQKHPGVASTYTVLGNTLAKQGNYSMAVNYYNKSELALNYDAGRPDYFEKVSDPLELQNTLIEKSFCYYSMNDNNFGDSYRDSLKESYIILMALDDYIRKELISSSGKPFYSNESTRVFEGLIGNILENRKREDLVSSLQIAEKYKGRVLSEKIRDESLSTSFGIPDSLREHEYDLNVDIALYDKKKFKERYESKVPNDSLITAYENKLFTLRNERDRLQDIFKEHYTNYYNARYSQQVISLAGIQDSLLKTNQALLEYFIGDSSVFTFTILPDTFYVNRIKKDFPLNSWVKDILKGIYSPFTQESDTSETEYSFQQAASSIYEKIFHHVDLILPEGTEIILVPDGILGYIPFDILLTDSANSESYLLKDHQISYAYSATLQAEMEKMEHEHQAQKKILAFAPSFDHAKTTGDTNVLASRFIEVNNSRNWLGPLNYNDDEVRSISQMLPTDVFMDSTATKDQFIQNASNYSIIHLSTHGKANDKMGDYSFLAFYDPQDSSETLAL